MSQSRDASRAPDTEQGVQYAPGFLQSTPSLLQSMDCRVVRADSGSDSENGDLEKEMSAGLTPSAGSQDGSASEDEDEHWLFSLGRRRLTVLAATGAAAAMLIVVLVWHVAGAGQAASAAGDSRNQPLPGVTLQPSNTMLPGLPDAVVPPSNSLPGLPDPVVPAAAVAPAASPAETAPGRYELETQQKPSVVFGMLIENLDFSQLTEHSNTLASFNGTVKQAVASIAGNGVSSDDVALALSPGSVVVKCTVAVPTAGAAEVVQAALESSHRLAGDLELNLEALFLVDMFQSISTGRIAVSGMSTPVIHGTTKPPPTTTGLPTTTVPTTPPPPTTTVQTCLAKGSPCMLHSQCCSRRCTPVHKCAVQALWV